MKGAAGLEYSVDVPKDGHRLREVLDRDGDRHRVEGLILEGKPRVGVQVMDDPIAQLGVLGHLDRVEAEAHRPSLELLGQMGPPAAHQVQYHAVQGQDPGEELSDRGDGVVVYVDDKTGALVEQPAVALVLSAKELGGKTLRPLRGAHARESSKGRAEASIGSFSGRRVVEWG